MPQPSLSYATQLVYYTTIKINGYENHVLPCYENLGRNGKCLFNAGEKQDIQPYVYWL